MSFFGTPSTGYAATFLLPHDPKSFTEGNWSWVFEFAKKSCSVKNQDEKIKAILELQKFVKEDWGGSAFKHLDKKTVAYELLLRVLEPRLVNQRGLALCGPATVVMIVAKTDPVAYVKCAVDLFVWGSGRLRLWQLNPDQRIKDFDPSGFMPHADWLVLASVRNQIGDFLINKSLPEQYGKTTIRGVYDWLVYCGFQYVMHLPVNHAPAFHGCDSGHWLLSNRDPKTLLGNFQIADDACGWGGWFVNLCFEGEYIAKHGTKIIPKSVPQLPSQAVDEGLARGVDYLSAQLHTTTESNHAVWLKKCKRYVIRDDPVVDLVLYSWGSKWQLNAVPVKNLVPCWEGINLASDTNPLIKY